MRTFAEIQGDAARAGEMRDTTALLHCAAELDELHTQEADTSAHMLRGAASYMTGSNAVALEHFHKALEVYDSLDNQGDVAATLVNIGSVHAAIGEFPTAIEFFTRALSIHEELGDRLHVARDVGNIGNTYSSTGDYPSALKQFNQAMALYEELDNHFGMAIVAGNLGVLHRRTGNFEASLEHLHRSVALHEEVGNNHGVAISTSNIGGVLHNMGNNVEALEYLRRSSALHKDNGNHKNAILVAPNILTVLIELGSVAEANALLSSLDNEQIDEPEWWITLEFCRAQLLEHQDDLDATEKTLRTVLTLASKHGIRSQVAAAHYRLRDLAQKRNDFAAYIEHNNEYTRITEEINGKDTAARLATQEAQREIAKERSEHQKHLAILHSTLPKHIADRVARGEAVNDHYDNAAVIFLDIAGFTTLSDQLTSQQVVQLLDSVFTTLDAVCKKHDVVKIKTIGDSYMAVAFPLESSNSEQRVANSEQRAASAALDMLHEVSHVISPIGSPIRVRIGIHCGPVTAGVIGTERMQYDVWGDTVNVASRMENTSEPGRVHVSETFFRSLTSFRDDGVQRHPDGGEADEGPNYTLIERGTIDVKGKGTMKTYWLE